MAREIIDKFYTELVDRLSKSYQDEIFKIFDNLPKAVIHFNDIEMLKKAQLYVRHTDRIFGKAIARLFVSLFNEIGIDAKTANDSMGKCVFVKQDKTRYHFIMLERVAGFPNVPWFKSMNESRTAQNDRDIYIILTEKDSNSISYLNKLNSLLNTRQRGFQIFEDFVKEKFSLEVWNLINNTFEKIEKNARQYQWFELVGVCNNLNLSKLREEIENSLLNFNYINELESTNIEIDTRSLTIMKSQFLQEKNYKFLLQDFDFSQSLLTSEWLYNNSKINKQLDNTYFVTGYIKSVEQLLSWIISGFPSDYRISVNTFEGLKKVKLDSDEFFNATLGNMLYFLKDFDNRGVYNKGIGRYAINGVYKIIQSWVQNERNGYFHKDNFSSIEKVKFIRNRTFLVYFLLLGSLNLQM